MLQKGKKKLTAYCQSTVIQNYAIHYKSNYSELENCSELVKWTILYSSHCVIMPLYWCSEAGILGYFQAIGILKINTTCFRIHVQRTS